MTGSKKNLQCLPDKEKVGMIRKGRDRISKRRQCELLDLNRSTAYYKPVPVSESALRLMHRTDELFTESPFFGSRRLTEHLNVEGFGVGRDKVRFIMRRLGLEAVYPKKNTSISTQTFFTSLYPLVKCTPYSYILTHRVYSAMAIIDLFLEY